MKRLVTLSLLLLAAGCAKEPLAGLDKLFLNTPRYIKLEAGFCLSAPVVSKQKVKYLFVLDKSDSNQPSTSGNGTDPTGSRRYGPLVQFLTDLPADPNQLTSFSLISFNDNAFVPNRPGYVNGFDTNRANFQQIVRAEWVGLGTPQAPQPDDRGFTNYVSALQMALSIVRADAQRESSSIERPIVTSAYRVIFVSDGEPKVPSGSGTYTQTFQTDILPQISSLQALKNDPVLGPFIGDIILNTAYYFTGTQEPGAIALLEQMAGAGNGQFLKFGAGENVLYGAFAPPIRRVRRVLSDVYVDNLSAGWWDDGTFQMDTDGDGIPDIQEDKLGSNPGRADSDGNGVSDLVEYRLKGRPCQGLTCAVAQRNPFSVCDGLSPTVDSAGNTTFPDFDRDGLNDCEEFVLRSDKQLFDSNKDYIPDFLALKNGVPFIAGVNGAFQQPQGDGLWNYEKLKKGLPISLSKDKVVNFRTRVTTLEKASHLADGDRDCYRLTVDPLAVIGFNNRIRVQVIENTAFIDDKPSLQTAEKVVDNSATAIGFAEGDFR